MKLLFVDCCISQRGEESRTHKLAEAYLKAYLDVTFGEEKLEEFSFYLLAEGYTDTAKNHKYEIKVSCRFAVFIYQPRRLKHIFIVDKSNC